MTQEGFSRRKFLRNVAAGSTAAALTSLPGAVPATQGGQSPGAPVTVEPYPIAEPGKAAGTPPRLRIVTVDDLLPKSLEKLRQMAPQVELRRCRDLAELNVQVKNADAVYGKFDRETLIAGTRLKWIQYLSAGVDGIVSPELVESPIVLTNFARVASSAISETAIGLLLALARGIDRYLRQTDKRVWLRHNDHVEISGMTMGIVGMGGIGSAIARRAYYGFDMRILATDAKPLLKPHFVEELHDPGWFMEMVPLSDVLVSAVPHTPLTNKMFNEHVFRTMKKTAFFINMSRGKTVDTPALVRALNEGWIAGAGLDVTHPEPLPAHDPLWSAARVIITPHASSVSPRPLPHGEALFVENVSRYLAGQPLLNVVDKKRGY